MNASTVAHRREILSPLELEVVRMSVAHGTMKVDAALANALIATIDYHAAEAQGFRKARGR